MRLLVDEDCCRLWGQQWLSLWWLPPSRSDVTSHVLSDALPVTEHGCGHRDLRLVAWLDLYSLSPIDWARFHYNILYIYMVHNNLVDSRSGSLWETMWNPHGRLMRRSGFSAEISLSGEGGTHSPRHKPGRTDCDDLHCNHDHCHREQIL